MIYLLYQKPWPVGGSVTFVAHLVEGLRRAGVEHTVLRVGNKRESHPRPLGEYGFSYRNVTLEDVLALKDPVLLTMGDPEIVDEAWSHLALMPNLWAVFHDPGEFSFRHWSHLDKTRVICVRPTGLKWFPEAQVILHPYAPHYEDPPLGSRLPACSIARISGPKNSEWLFAANEQLPEHLRIHMRGAWARFWWYHRIRPRYPLASPIPSPNGFPRAMGAAAEVCSQYSMMFDVSDICCEHWGQGKAHTHPNDWISLDGGGTQYTLLEAMDGGAIPVVSDSWLMEGSLPFQHLSVRDSEEVVGLMTSRIGPELQAGTRHNHNYIREHHDPARIALKYQEVIC